MTCIIIEDQVPAQRILQKYIEDAKILQLKGTFSSALEAMEFLKNNTVDIVFLDIHLPKLTGLEFIKSLSNRPNIILTTAFSDYALESYEYNVIDYLLKPFSFQRFLKAIAKVSKTPGNSDRQTSQTINDSDDIYIKSGHEYRKLKVSDISFIKSDTDYTVIYTKETKHLSVERLKHWEEVLPKDLFLRIHKSYLINTKKIVKFLGNRVYLDNDMELPIGRLYKEAFVNKVLNQ
ncbi:LytR/AlgR family response regulator transcription factor [Muriicola soli]|uniref:Response regulator transcription factor n=1 Tax=Muriicola soli TaxID=2507538 RepID=A0A411ECP3_9FLAO|nr:LytTR family DNA-binding domain-containing protein [Muriicola soli]QBA65502.1 response regulator transcription factor [Muriicola soli]